MSRQRKPKVAIQPEVAHRDGEQRIESLPLPVVAYPGFYGAFFAFSSHHEPARLRLCACSRPALINYLELERDRPRNAMPDRAAAITPRDFPLALAAVLADETDPLSAIEFEEAICHRCNLVRPSLDYCSPMYGGQFIRGHGWYVNQTFYRLGVTPRPQWSATADESVYLGHHAIEGVCPPDLLKLLERDREVAAAYRQEHEKLEALARGPRRSEIPDDEPTYWTNVRVDEAADYVVLRRQAAQASRAITTYVENLVRQEFGFRKVGEGWVSETLLAALVSRILSGHEVIRHHRPSWLEGLELDVFVPDLDLGIEYQGQQHFHAIDAWGGADALAALQERDARKAVLCRAKGVQLLTFDYTEPITEEYVAAWLAEALGESA